MSNSPLISYTHLSPNRTSPRNHKIDTITPHCTAGHISLKRLGEWFARKETRASSNYGIDDNGNIGLFVEEKNRSWCSGSAWNDHRAVTVEIASDNVHPFKMTNSAIEGFVRLATDICVRNDIPKLLWRGDISLAGQVDRQNITVHRWFQNKSCPGDYFFAQIGELAEEVNRRIMNAKKEGLTIYNRAEDVPEWAYPTIKKLIKKKAIQGDQDGNLMLTMEMIRIFVAHDRLEIYGK